MSSTILEPGQEGTLTINLHMGQGMDGPHHFLIHVMTNDPVEPETQLNVYGNFGDF